MKTVVLSKIFPILCCLMLSGILSAQDATSARSELQQLRSEISDLESKLKSASSKLQNEMENLKNFDQQVSLTTKALRLLRNEIRQSERELVVINTQIDSLNGQIRRLQGLLREQVVFAYKYQRDREWDWLLGSENFNQAVVRYRYFQSVSDNGQRMFERLKTKQAELETLQSARVTALESQKQMANEKAAEQKALEKKRVSRQALVDKISRNTKLYEQAIVTKKESASRLQNLIASLQRERDGSSAPTEIRPEIDWSRVKGNFAGQRKKLNWPVEGKIVHPFGNYKNPRLKTVLVNNGIDIQAKKGAEVRCVFSGVVSTITYISGFGNTIIVDHNNGYYTVYAHLDEVLVNKFQVVDAGTILGTVGDTGSLEGAKLHFEIYGNNQPQNPTLWLNK